VAITHTHMTIYVRTHDKIRRERYIFIYRDKLVSIGIIILMRESQTKRNKRQTHTNSDDDYYQRTFVYVWK